MLEDPSVSQYLTSEIALLHSPSQTGTQIRLRLIQRPQFLMSAPKTNDDSSSRSDIEQTTTSGNTNSPSLELDRELSSGPFKTKVALKVLSGLVISILREKEKMKNKHLVDEVVKELNFQEASRVEKGIRRRIYDVVNVLVAAGKVEKIENILYYKPAEDACSKDETILLQKRARMDKLSENIALLSSLCKKNKRQDRYCDKLFFPSSVLALSKRARFEVEESESSLALTVRGQFKHSTELEILRILHSRGHLTIIKFPKKLYSN